MASKELRDPFAEEGDPFTDTGFDDPFEDEANSFEMAAVNDIPLEQDLDSDRTYDRSDMTDHSFSDGSGGQKRSNASQYLFQGNAFQQAAARATQSAFGKKEKRYLSYQKKGFFERVTLTTGYTYLIGKASATTRGGFFPC